MCSTTFENTERLQEKGRKKEGVLLVSHIKGKSDDQSSDRVINADGGVGEVVVGDVLSKGTSPVSAVLIRSEPGLDNMRHHVKMVVQDVEYRVILQHSIIITNEGEAFIHYMKDGALLNVNDEDMKWMSAILKANEEEIRKALLELRVVVPSIDEVRLHYQKPLEFKLRKTWDHQKSPIAKRRTLKGDRIVVENDY